MITNVTTTATPYLVKLPGRAGFYFQRKVPADLVRSIGRRLWRWKAGNTLTEARKAVVKGLNKTDVLIAQHRGEVTPALLKHIDENLTPDPLTVITRDFKEVDGQEVEVTVEDQLTPQDLYPRFSEEAAQRLVERQEGKGRKAEDLVNLAARLKQPAPSTKRTWMAYISKAMSVANRQCIDEFTEDDARKYRDHLIDTCGGNTTKSRIRSVKGLFNVAKDEGWIKTNPFDCISLRYIKTKTTQKEVKRLDDIDKLVSNLPEHHQCLYWIMRCTGTHVSEAAGLRYEDIDPAGRVIHVRANELRPLKNDFRKRELPIIEALNDKLNELLKQQDSGYIFPGLYNERIERWGQGMNWERRLGISPKACRDAVATTLRDADINERVLGAILGHTPKNSTGVYGAVSMEAKQRALENLIK